MDAIKIVEKLLTGSVYTNYYIGKDIYNELSRIAEHTNAGSVKTLEFLSSWQLLIDPQEIYRRSGVQDSLLDLWSIIKEETIVPEPDAILSV